MGDPQPSPKDPPPGGHGRSPQTRCWWGLRALRYSRSTPERGRPSPASPSPRGGGRGGRTIPPPRGGGGLGHTQDSWNRDTKQFHRVKRMTRGSGAETASTYSQTLNR